MLLGTRDQRGSSRLPEAAAIRNFKSQEHSVSRFGDEWEQFVNFDGPMIKQGKIQIPDKPGLGVTLNEDKVRANLFPGEQWWGS
jgi:L-alanine-DL-glutamate epimerase-like enolase superfamily enzyme